MLTSDETLLFAVYRSGSAAGTAGIIRESLADIYDPDMRAAAENLLLKLEGMSREEFDSIDIEIGGYYER